MIDVCSAIDADGFHGLGIGHQFARMSATDIYEACCAELRGHPRSKHINIGMVSHLAAITDTVLGGLSAPISLSEKIGLGRAWSLGMIPRPEQEGGHPS